METTQKERINQFLDYALPLRDAYMSSGNQGVATKIYSEAVKIFNCSATPGVLDDEKFMDCGGPLLFRGMPKAGYQQQLIEGSEYFVRESSTFDIDAFGIYTSTLRDKALDYTKETPDSEPQEDLILHLKVSKDAKIADRSILDDHCRSLQSSNSAAAPEERALKNALQDLNGEDWDYVMGLFYNYKSILGVVLGYDGVVTEFDDQKYYCMFNRGKLLVPQSEAEYFRSKAQEEAKENEETKEGQEAKEDEENQSYEATDQNNHNHDNHHTKPVDVSREL